MYAIVEDSGTQIRVAPGDVVEINMRDGAQEGSKISFDRVLLVGPDEGEATIGRTYVSGASVTADVLGEKVENTDVIKYKRRKGYKRKHGHTQRSLRVKIGDIKA